MPALPPDRPLDAAAVDADPLSEFHRWLAEAEAAGLPLAEAVALATATRDGIPSARMVLVKGADERGFAFFTNVQSRKGRELDENPRAALVFYWHALGRQVRVEGTVERVTAEEADAYFRTRPRGSRIGAWASPQSAVVASRDELDARAAELDAELGDDVPLPPFWGGFRVAALAIEFWQHRDDRLHDRIRYRRKDVAGGWVVERLAP